MKTLAKDHVCDYRVQVFFFVWKSTNILKCASYQFPGLAYFKKSSYCINDFFVREPIAFMI